MKSIMSKWNYLRMHPAFQKKAQLVIWRLLIWRIRCLLRLWTTISLDKWSVKIILPPKWRGVSKLIYVFRDNYEQELENLRRYLSVGSMFIDVGANYGLYSLIAAKCVGESGKVICFEPASENFEILKKNLQINHAENVIPLPFGLSDKAGRMNIYYHPDPGRASLFPHQNILKSEEVLVTTLDQILSELEVDSLDYIKIDTEGADFLVILGSKEAICHYRPVVQFEYNTEFSETVREVQDFISQMDYVILDGQRNQIDSLEQKPGGNYLAIPREKKE